MLTHHKVRELLVTQRTQLINALRGHLAEIGVIAAQGPTNAHDLAELIEEGDEAIAAAARAALKPVVRQLNIFDAEIAQSDRAIQEISRADETARRLMNIGNRRKHPGCLPSRAHESLQSSSGSRHGRTHQAAKSG